MKKDGLYIIGARVVFFIYDLLFFTGLLLYLPVYFARKKINFQALKEKFGLLKGEAFPSEVIWIQAVSVGEVNLLGGLIKKLKEISRQPLLISTTTLTGNRVAKAKYSSFAEIIFFPFDISWALAKVLGAFKPKIFISLETEIWPNLFWRLAKRGIPILILNARVSDKAFKKYRLIKPLIKRILNKCNYIGVQNHAYKERFLSLGAGPQKIVVSGNMKFQSLNIDENILKDINAQYLPVLKGENRTLLIAGSTHSPEEEYIINAYRNILTKENNLALLIAPRHPERVPAVEKLIRLQGFKPLRISQALNSLAGAGNIFILDTVGVLFYFYSLADICFVGGSLVKAGGQNILEPVYFLKPTVFGPHMDNFKDIQEIVLEKGAGIQVNQPKELEEVLSRLIQDQALRNNLRNKCREVFASERKSIETNLELISRCLVKERKVQS